MKGRSVHIFPVSQAYAQPIEDPNFTSRLSLWDRGVISLEGDGTHFGYVATGSVELRSASGCFQLRSGMYFSVPGQVDLEGSGCGFVASRVGWKGFFQVGGPVEERGRLSYIDGCSDSLLISPVVWGDPCLNLLYLPPGTTQTAHTHPSCRLGMIASGAGVCKTPAGDIDLQPGLVFNIAPDALHSFHTSAEPLRVIAWHPDSDFGPEQRNHPMINRTLIDGISAAQRTWPASLEEQQHEVS